MAASHGVVGVDVSKAFLDVARRNKQGFARRRFENTKAGVLALGRFLGRRRSLVVVEATGSYSALVHEQLTESGFPVAVVNPKRVRDIARGLGREAKTDVIDAETLVLFGEFATPEPTPLPSAAHRELRALIQRRKQLVEDRTRLMNQRASASSALGEGEFNAVDKVLRRSMQRLETRIMALLEHDEIKHVADELQRQKGVGAIIAATLLVDIPELGTIGYKQVASLVGLAPHANESGTTQKRRYVRGGRFHPRSALYMAALVGVRHDETLKAFYERLQKAGKPKKLALIAVARKILVWLNARVRDLFAEKILQAPELA